MKVKYIFILIVITNNLFLACKKTENEPDVLLTLHESSHTGLNFENRLDIQPDVNILNYMYYYNGGGLAAGDFNNDGLIDLYFTSNLYEDKMYLNRGDLKFEDISNQCNVDAGQGGWTTGASVVDINADGLLDIYVCQVGKYLDFDAKNRLLICQGIDENGIPQYRDEAQQYGLAFQGFSTQAGFFDYDLDGDLDMYLLNHSVHQNNTYGPRKDFLGTYHDLSGDRIFRNDGSTFTDVTKECGIESNVIGYGLGLAFGDVNLDGYPDIYVANDFHENDYLYINQKDGSFSEELTKQMMHSSKFSMGCDIGDLNNDLYPDIFTLDMRPEDPGILKRSEGEESVSVFNFKRIYGYYAQYAMNNLQLNNGNESFSEVARYAGVEATDWSWSPLILDLNLDGKKDLFVTNGIPKRANDIDYINYYASTPLTYKIRSGGLEEEDLEIINLMPSIKLKNKLFIHDASMQFIDAEDRISNNIKSYSNSAVYADFDNDGDYDIVCSNINQKVFLYENNTVSTKKEHNKRPVTIKVSLAGPTSNLFGIGAKVLAYSGEKTQIFENFSTRAFQSSTISPIIFSFGTEGIDSLKVVWYDGRYETKVPSKAAQEISFDYEASGGSFDYNSLVPRAEVSVTDFSKKFQVDGQHRENEFIEFHREPLIPHQTSDHGPALAVGDLNGDGLDDIFLGSSKLGDPYLYFQQSDKTFKNVYGLNINLDSTFEQNKAVIDDFNGDGLNDLLIGNGGNEYYIHSDQNKPQLFINQGKGLLKEKKDAFDEVYATTGGLSVGDFDNDGDLDVFIGGRAMPFAYGEIPRSYFLLNNGSGVFLDKTKAWSTHLDSLGMIKASATIDINNDGLLDLVIAPEWEAVYAFINTGSGFNIKTLTDRKGWWNCVRPIDYDGDGDQDLLIGNLGANSRLRPSKSEPVTMYYNDFDGNGRKEQIITFYKKGKEITLAQLGEIHGQIPKVKKAYQYAKDFSEASIVDVFGKKQISEAATFTVDFLDNALLRNEDGTFVLESLPLELQMTAYMDAGSSNPNKFLLVVGNYFGSAIGLGRDDADFGTLLRRDANGQLRRVNVPSLKLRGQARNVESIRIGDKEYLAVAMNDEALKVLGISTLD